MYYFAEFFHFSGVLAVVSGGLFLSSKRQSMLTYKSRVQGINVWGNLVFVMNGLIFLFIGLQLPSIVKSTWRNQFAKSNMVWPGDLFVLIVARFLCTFGASLFTRFISRFIKVADANPGWKGPIVLGWGVCVAWYLLQWHCQYHYLLMDKPFLIVTYFVHNIYCYPGHVGFPGTYTSMGYTESKVEDRYNTIPEQEQELIIQKKIAKASLQLLEEKYDGERKQNEHLNILSSRLQTELNFFQQDLKELANSTDNSLIRFQRIYLELLERQRQMLKEMNRKDEFDEELIRKYLALIDLEELKTREKLLEEG
jgi:CPA1 family monovalent cation:H+ antiporter